MHYQSGAITLAAAAPRIAQPRQPMCHPRRSALIAPQRDEGLVDGEQLAEPGDELADREAGRMATLLANGQPQEPGAWIAERPEARNAIRIAATHGENISGTQESRESAWNR